MSTTQITTGSLHKTGRLVALVLPAFLAIGLSADISGHRHQRLGPSSSASLQGAVQTPTSAAGCPNPEGGACLGAIAAGRHTSKRFRPELTYTVPAGWSNFEDHEGNFLLVPPGGTLAGVNGDTSDFVGVATSAVLADGCDFNPPGGVAATPSAFSEWLRGNAAFSTSNAHPATVGGLSGEVLDLRLARDWTRTCPFWTTTPVVALMSGRKPSSFEHVLIRGTAIRLYLLSYRDGVLRIELTDVGDLHHLDQYSRIVEGFAFKG